MIEELARRVSPRVLEAPARLDPVRRELDEYFAGRRTEFATPIDWSHLAGFTRKVLRATARIGFGETSTYAGVASRAGSPRAMRAAGNALGANPMPVIVPCHRVLRTGGALAATPAASSARSTCCAWRECSDSPKRRGRESKPRWRFPPILA